MKLVLLDLDNTLIDSQYRLTAPEHELRPLVQRLASRNVVIGLCSDSAIVTLQQFASRLGLHGPLVAERGAVIWDSRLQTEIILDKEETAWFRQFREAFISEVTRTIPNLTLVVGDATRFVKSQTSPALTENIVVVNGFRVASFSCFTCALNEDQTGLIPNPVLFREINRLAKKLARSFGKENLFWDDNLQYGVLIIHALGTEKRQGIKRLLEQLSPSESIMIGDGLADFLDLPQVTQYAVANADPDYKAKAQFIAEKALTEGVVECLQHLTSEDVT